MDPNVKPAVSPKVVIFIFRLILGLAGGWFLSYFFFEGSLVVAGILFALVIVAAYASEAWRLKGTKKKK